MIVQANDITELLCLQIKMMVEEVQDFNQPEV